MATYAWDGLRYFIVALPEPSINYFYSSHRLIIGKEEIDIFSVSLGIFGFFFTEMFIV